MKITKHANDAAVLAEIGRQLDLGNFLEVNDELEKITSRLRANPFVRLAELLYRSELV